MFCVKISFLKLEIIYGLWSTNVLRLEIKWFCKTQYGLISNQTIIINYTVRGGVKFTWEIHKITIRT